MRLIQCIAARDHEAIDMLIAAGVHPLNNFERVVRLRHDAVEILMQHVKKEDYKTVVSLAKHLWRINNYPEAHQALRAWLIKTRVDTKNSHITQTRDAGKAGDHAVVHPTTSE